MKTVPILLLLLLASAAQAQPAIWRCQHNGRVVYQQEACGGRLVGTQDRRTEAQKRAEREAARREREKAAEQAKAASDAASGAATPVPKKTKP